MRIFGEFEGGEEVFGELVVAVAIRRKCLILLKKRSNSLEWPIRVVESGAKTIRLQRQGAL